MKVVTLTSDRFTDACARLQAQMVHEGFRPELVVGIATGGVRVAGLIFADVPHVDVVCRRPSTEGKRRAASLMRLVCACPLWVRNALRIAEARWLQRRAPSPVDFSATEQTLFAVAMARTILVVDDAVDSGRTMRRVLDELHRVNAGAAVRTAVLTVTTDNPLVTPDFKLYDDKTLLRFPWSMDMK